ncbi:MAG: hypothetical protein IKO28_03400 [Prevotella sp.]|nr:hypothetical protein [Prevotella sp.]MBR4572447.1 hypothetical protein [Prevotella sp.]
MKQILIITALFVSIACSAGEVEKVSGDVKCLKDADTISVIMNYSEAIYAPKYKKVKNAEGKETKQIVSQKGLFNDFLREHKRTRTWEIESLDYFCEWFGDEVPYPVVFPQYPKAKYEFVIKIDAVYKDGNISGLVLLVNKDSNKTEAMFSFESGDADADDKIALRDPLKDIGERMGKCIKKLLK